MTSRKKPSAGFWITVALVAVLAYPASFGPACWISSRSGIGGSVVNFAYQPMLGMAFEGPEVIRRGTLWYVQLLAKRGWIVCYVSGRYEWGRMPV